MISAACQVWDHGYGDCLSRSCQCDCHPEMAAMTIKHFSGLWPAAEITSMARLNQYVMTGRLLVQSNNASEWEN